MTERMPGQMFVKDGVTYLEMTQPDYIDTMVKQFEEHISKNHDDCNSSPTRPTLANIKSCDGCARVTQNCTN